MVYIISFDHYKDSYFSSVNIEFPVFQSPNSQNEVNTMIMQGEKSQNHQSTH